MITLKKKNPTEELVYRNWTCALIHVLLQVVQDQILILESNIIAKLIETTSQIIRVATEKILRCTQITNRDDRDVDNVCGQGSQLAETYISPTTGH